MMPGFPYDESDVAYDGSLRARENALAVLRPLRPFRAQGVAKRRIGKDHDGGYVMLDDFAGITAAYSLGISDDVSWDLEFAERGIDVFQYDHTIDALPHSHPRFHWSRKGVAGDRGTDLATLADVIAENGHGDARSLILKCDIECSEWQILALADRDLLKPFRQIVIEVHALMLLNQEAFASMARKAVATLTAHHRVVHVHGNNHGPIATVGGIAVPSVLEFTLARRDAYTFARTGELFPTKIDMPNKANAADLALGCFRF